MRNVILAAALACTGLAGCVTSPERYAAWESRLPPVGDAPSLDEARQAARAYLERNLKDPYSARIEWGEQPPVLGNVRGAFEQRGSNGWVYGASVNAKNSYGGYTGAKEYRFVIRSKQVTSVYRMDGHARDWVSEWDLIPFN